MTEIKQKLYKAFTKDHALLGNGFSLLAEQLQKGNLMAVRHAANLLDQKSGAHIAFEEIDFTPC